MTAQIIHGDIVFLDEAQSMLGLSDPDKKSRKKRIKGIVRRIGFRGRLGRWDGIWAETMGITYSWVLARDCYIAGVLAATMYFASTAVEIVINRDERMQYAKKKQLQEGRKKKRPEPSDWLVLNRHNLREALMLNLPVNELLGIGESLEKGAPLITFLERRNKVAHGDYSGGNFTARFQSYNDIMAIDRKIMRNDVGIRHREALDQFIKCSNFLYAWVEQKPRIMGFARN